MFEVGKTYENGYGDTFEITKIDCIGLYSLEAKRLRDGAVNTYTAQGRFVGDHAADHSYLDLILPEPETPKVDPQTQAIVDRAFANAQVLDLTSPQTLPTEVVEAALEEVTSESLKDYIGTATPDPGLIGLPALKAFLFVLLRDEVSFGKVEAILENHIEKMRSEGNTATYKDAKLLEDYTESLAKRILGVA